MKAQINGWNIKTGPKFQQAITFDSRRVIGPILYQLKAHFEPYDREPGLSVYPNFQAQILSF